MKQRKALIAAISGLGALAVTTIAIGFDLAVVSAPGQSPDRTRSGSDTAVATPATEWVQLRMSGPGGFRDFSITLHHTHIHLGIG